MKLKSLLVAALLGVAAAFSVHASTSYTNGDLFLFVGSVTGADSYVVDLGQNFNWNTSFQIPIASLTTDVTDAVGSGWQTNTNVYFAVVGGTTSTGETSVHMVISNSSPSAFGETKANPLDISSGVNTIVSGWGGNDSATSGLSGGNSQALEEINSSSSSFANVMSQGFNSFSSGNAEESPVTGSVYLDTVQSSFPSSSAPGTELGTFAVDSANNSLDFTTAAVPEPSTIATVLLGGAALFAMGRRRLRA